MKKVLYLTLLTLCMFFAMGNITAYAGETKTGTLCENGTISWTYDADEKVLTVTGEGELYSDGPYDVFNGWVPYSPFYDICSDVKKIILKDCKLTGSAKALFASLESLETLELNNVDTSEVTDMAYMFYNCFSIKDLDLRGFDTSSVRSMKGMFFQCDINTLDLSSFDLSNVEPDDKIWVEGISKEPIYKIRVYLKSVNVLCTPKVGLADDIEFELPYGMFIDDGSDGMYHNDLDTISWLTSEHCNMRVISHFDGWESIMNGKYWYYYKDFLRQTGWIYDNSKWYYCDPKSGKMLTGWIQDDGSWYYMNKSGVMQTGWVKDDGTWYYMNESGAMQTGWIKSGGSWYYMDKSGAMQTGWIKSDGKWYYLKSSGAMATGWVKDGGTWYYMNRSGVMQTGWIKSGGKWYYLYGSGAMATNTKIGSYYVNASGVWVR